LKDQLADGYERRFEGYWIALKPGEKRVLRRLAEDPPHLPSEREAYPLLSMGLLFFQRENGYTFFCSGFHEFVRQQNLKKSTLPSPKLARNESRLYDYLSTRSGEVCSYADLWQAVWGSTGKSSPEEIKRRVQVLSSRLRLKLDPNIQGQIESVWNQGYRLTFSTAIAQSNLANKSEQGDKS
jgi:DNA-binding winged helix-turn-helix (wHTH) protein